MTLFLIGMSGVFTGALIVILAFYLLLKYQDQKEKKRRVIEQKAKEIETLIHLNQKMVEILEKRVLLMDKYVSFDAFDDCYITVDDYIYLQSFAAHNSFYLPNRFLEEFFNQISTRKVVLSPEETLAIGGYTFKGGRVIIEQLSDKITEMIYERKVQLKKVTDEPLTLFSRAF
ncbi:hypothetical protein [Enterococcus lemanii]|uniref:HTH LytTR-type domain-containing protein n=1 Tax=Enterococcus lemanii TaxID=1159752 RepID=A0ABV9MX46_9ENTE|nr:hypothetical protein [Enterococcus lemanii]MBM7709693.1 hypothetical protein [Enterococcus lemanii]NLM68007.1 hypothetical protein [Enterococcus sp.]